MVEGKHNQCRDRDGGQKGQRDQAINEGKVGSSASLLGFGCIAWTPRYLIIIHI
jgi:hypothetical protein